MIDIKTGAISVDGVDFVIHPALTREEYLSSPLAGARVNGGNEPYGSFTTGVLEIMGDSFLLTLNFYGSDLTSVDLFADDERFGTSWADWSKEKELERKRFHESWLGKVLGNDHYPYDYDWGSAESFYNEKAGFSYITVRYRKRHV
ncbi:MAG TPA: hypothetical protein VI306_02500 [Pyrinomonadaceae bacterium]